LPLGELAAHFLQLLLLLMWQQLMWVLLWSCLWLGLPKLMMMWHWHPEG
jgi:hypothetical protein